MNCSPPSSFFHGIFQARILEGVAISYFRGSSWPRDQTHISWVSCIGRQVLFITSELTNNVVRVSGEQQRDSAFEREREREREIHTHIHRDTDPFSPPLPSRPHCRITLSRVPRAVRRSLLIHFKNTNILHLIFNQSGFPFQITKKHFKKRQLSKKLLKKRELERRKE